MEGKQVNNGTYIYINNRLSIPIFGSVLNLLIHTEWPPY